MAKTLNRLSDTELIRAIKLSDAAAFKIFYGRYYEILFRFLWRRTRDSDVAEDLLQELFIRVWRRRSKLDERQLIKAYLYKMANNLAIDHLRKKMTRQTLDVDLQTPDYYVDLIDSLEIREEAEKALQSLTEKQRQVFLLSRFEGLKYAESADMLQISVKAVEKRMTKALQTLRQKLEHLLLVLFILKVSGNATLELPIAGTAALLLSGRRSHSHKLLKTMHRKLLTTPPFLPELTLTTSSLSSQISPDISFFDFMGKLTVSPSAHDIFSASLYLASDDVADERHPKSIVATGSSLENKPAP